MNRGINFQQIDHSTMMQGLNKITKIIKSMNRGQKTSEFTCAGYRFY